MQRRETTTVWVGGIPVGSGHPVVVQSMTNTDTADIESTANQVRLLAEAGSELVRVTVNTPDAARALPRVVDELDRAGCHVPVIGDFHYNGHQLLSRYPACARALAKYRINPGNVGMGRHRDANFSQMIEAAMRYEKPVRIGVNWGSLDQALLARLMDENAARPQPLDARDVLIETIIRSAVESAEMAVECGLPADRIIISAKVSDVPDLIEVYRRLAERCDHPLHLGLTEAGMGTRGVVASSAGLAVLLHQGIGDTIRVSLTPKPGGDRAQEVRVAQNILQALNIRRFAPQVAACPGCGRTTSTFFQELADRIQGHLEERMPIWRETRPGVANLKVAVMGCVVNGPGESKHADIGISLPGTGEAPKAPVFVDSRHFTTLKGPHIAEKFIQIVEEYVEQRYAAHSDAVVG